MNGKISVRTVVAGLVLAGMFGLAWLDRVIVRTRVMKAVNEQSLAAGVNLSEVQEVKITNRNGEVRIVRQQTGWQVMEPFTAVADAEKVETVIYNITGARRNNEIAAKNLATYGLAEPMAKLEMVYGPSRETFKLALGNDSTYTGQVFAQFPGGRTLFTVGSHVKNTLLAAPSEFRRSRLLDVDTGSLASYQSISIGGTAAPVELRQERGRWNIIAPMEGVAETSVVEEWLKAIGLLRADSFLSAQGNTQTSATEALVALTSPSVTLSLARSGQPPQDLHLAQIAGGQDRIWVARRPGDPEIMVIRPELISVLRQDAGAFRSRQLFTLKPEEVGQFSASVGQARTDLIRNEKGKWTFADRPGCDVDQDAVAVRLELLLKTRAKQFIDLNPQDITNFGIGRIRFTVTSKDGQRTELLETGDLERGGGLTSVYARRRGDPAIFTMELTPELIILSDKIANKHFARFNYERLSRLSIELGSDIHEITLADRAWRLRRAGESADGPAEKPKVDRFLNMLDNLQSVRDFSCSGDRVISPPAQNHFAIKSFDGDGGLLLELTIGRTDGDRVFVTVNDRVVQASNAELERLIAQALSVVQ